MAIPYTFRRLTAPPTDLNQYVSPSPVWPYINNAPGVNQAPVDPSATGSTRNNTGSFFVAFQDDASSSLANRPHQVLAMNTDTLDAVVRRSMGVVAKRIAATTDPLQITSGWVWTGDSTDNDIKDIVRVVSRVSGQEGACLSHFDGDVWSYPVVVDILQGGASKLYSGFINADDGAVTIVLDAVAGTTDVYVYYVDRASYATASTGSFVRHLLMPEVISVPVIKALRNIIGLDGHPGIGPYTGPTLAGLDRGLILRSLNAAYRQSSDFVASSRPDTSWPSEESSDPGAGGWIIRDGPGVGVYSRKGISVNNTDPIGACVKVFLQDVLDVAQTSVLVGGSSGFVSYGARGDRIDSLDVGYEKAYASFLAVEQRNPSVTIENECSTYVPVGTTAVLTSGVLVLNSPARWFSGSAGVWASGVTPGHDLVELTWAVGGRRQTFVITGLVTQEGSFDARKCYMMQLNGFPVPDSFDGACTVRWLPATFAVYDGSAGSSMDVADMFGMYYSAGQPDGGTPGYRSRGAGFFGLSGKESISWGLCVPTFTYGGQSSAQIKGRLFSDGSVSCTTVGADRVRSLRYRHGDKILVGSPSVLNIDSGDTFLVTRTSGDNTDLKFTLGLGPLYPVVIGDKITASVVHDATGGAWLLDTESAWDPNALYHTRLFSVLWESMADMFLSKTKVPLAGTAKWLDVYEFTVAREYVSNGVHIIQFAGRVTRGITTQE